MRHLLHPPSDDAGHTQAADQLLALSEQIWRELNEQMPHSQIHQLVLEAAAQFADATITTFIPLLIHRQVYAKLHAKMSVAAPQTSLRTRAEGSAHS
jgi:hypothetical protein